MKKVIIALMLLKLSIGAYSQEPQTNFHEIGLLFGTFTTNSFGLRYKYGNDNAMLRITLHSSI